MANAEYALSILAEAAELVLERREGTRRFYSLDPKILGELRAYVDGLWTDALANFNHASSQEGGDGND